MPDLTGTVLDDRYEIDRQIGQGGMGVVYAARQLRLNRKVAVKVPRPEVLVESVFRARFTREAHAMAKVMHENICQVYDVYVSEDPNHISYLVMEYIEGERLDHWIRKNLEGLTLGKLIDLFMGIGLGLDAAHAVEVIHRDIKPSNIIITNNGIAKIMDFGVAFARDDFEATRTGLAIGTPAFMAPEQVRGRGVLGPASDQYSLAMTIYKIVTGTIAFEANNSQELIYKQLHDTPIPPSSHNPNIPTPIELVLLKALSKNPEDRFGSCGEMVNCLREVIRGQENSPAASIFPDAREQGLSPIRLELTPALAMMLGEMPWWKKYQKKLAMGAGGAAGVIALISLLVWAFSGGSTPSPLPRPTPTPVAPRFTPVTGTLATPTTTGTTPEPRFGTSPSPTPAPRLTPTPSPTASATAAPPPTATPLVTAAPTPTAAPVATSVPTPAPRATPDQTPLPTPAPTPVITPIVPLDLSPTPIPTPVPVGPGEDEDIAAMDPAEVERDVRAVFETKLPQIFAKEDSAALKQLGLGLPARSREALVANFVRLSKDYRELELAVEVQPNSLSIKNRTATVEIRVLLKGKKAYAKEGAPAQTLKAKGGQTMVVELRRRDGQWLFVRFPDFLKDVVDRS